MRRRSVLSAVAAGSLAGCLTRGSTAPADGSSPTTPSWDGCPSFVDGVDRTVCATDRGDADVSLTPSSRRLVESETDQAVDTVTFTLRNEGDGEVRLNPHDWAVKRGTAAGWSHVAPDGGLPQPLLVLSPGETHGWRLATTQHPSGNDPDVRDVVADLPAEGTYAFRLHGWLGQVDASPHVEWVARFEYAERD